MGKFLVDFEVKDKYGTIIRGREEVWANSSTNAKKLVEIKFGDTCVTKSAVVFATTKPT